METTAIVEEIERLLGLGGSDPGILDRSGRVLMSGWNTVRPSPYYVLGINPGGKVPEPPELPLCGETIRASLRDQAESWSFYLDDPEAVPHYRGRFVSVMGGLGVDPRNVPASNALFLRSAGVGAFPKNVQQAFERHCAPVHKLLLGIVKPRVVVLFGIPSWQFMTGRAAPNWGFYPDENLRPADINYRCGVLFLPHFVQGGLHAWSEHAATLDQAVADAKRHAASINEIPVPGRMPLGPSLAATMFTREDLSKPENRANVLLLAAASIERFWKLLHLELGLKADDVLAPEKNTELGRPDLVVRRGGKRAALIECENWDENKKQSRTYLQAGLRLILILGTAQPEDGTTWVRIRELIFASESAARPRERIILELLKGAIEDILRLRRRKGVITVGRDTIPDGWLKEAATPLLALDDRLVGQHTVAEGSVSIRILGPRRVFRNNPRGGVFLVMSQRLRPHDVFLAGPRHLAQHLSDEMRGWVEGSWTSALRKVTGGIFSELGNGQVVVRTVGGMADPEDVAAALSDLVALLPDLSAGAPPL